MNQFSLVQAVDRFRQGVVITVAAATDRRFDARFGQPFAVSNADVWDPLSEWSVKVPLSPGRRA